MILKKPYAFLIRHFRLIHFLLFLVAGFLLLRTNNLYIYTNNFVNTMVYSSPISTVLDGFMYLSIWVLMIGFGVITYLLYYKKKPFIEYVIGIGIYILILILFYFLRNYFDNIGVTANVPLIRALKDLLLIIYIIEYVIVFYLLIKFMGLDLKKFGFKEDKDILAEEEDSEEVEVTLGFDKDKYIREIKKKARFLKYYLIEYKRIFIPIGCVLAGILFIVFLLNYEVTKTYKMKEEFIGNNYGIRINDAYFTDRTYDGNKISDGGTRKYLIVRFDLMNMSRSLRRFNLETFNLTTDTSIYHNSYSTYTYFEDLGKTYNDNYLESGVSYSYILIFEIEPMDFGKDYYLTYNTGGFRTTIRKVKLDIQDLTINTDYLTTHKDEDMTLHFYNGQDITFKIVTAAFKDEIMYYYEGCKSQYSCGTYTNSSKALNGKKILNINYISTDIVGEEFSSRLTRHGKIVYQAGEEKKEIPITEVVHVKYKGNFLYFMVPEEVEKSDYVEIKIVIRDKVYHYILKEKGEENEL